MRNQTSKAQKKLDSIVKIDVVKRLNIEISKLGTFTEN